MINMQELDDIERELALYKLKGESGRAEQLIIDEGLVSEEDPRSELGAFWYLSDALILSAFYCWRMLDSVLNLW